MTPREAGRRGSFADYYLRHVAISEGCGCAELVVRRSEPGRAGGALGYRRQGWWRRRWRALIAAFAAVR